MMVRGGYQAGHFAGTGTPRRLGFLWICVVESWIQDGGLALNVPGKIGTVFLKHKKQRVFRQFTKIVRTRLLKYKSGGKCRRWYLADSIYV